MLLQFHWGETAELHLTPGWQAKPWHRLAKFPAFPTTNWKMIDPYKFDCLDHQIYVLGHILYVPINLVAQRDFGYTPRHYDNEKWVGCSIRSFLFSELVEHSKWLMSMEGRSQFHLWYWWMLVVVEVWVRVIETLLKQLNCFCFWDRFTGHKKPIR